MGRPLPADFDPHKPFIDEYTWPAPGGGTMRRAPEVIDTWFDSGSMPFAQWHYPFENEAEFKRALPGRLHLRGRGPDARVVLLAAGDRDDGVRQPGVPERGRERPGARRRGPEDVEERRATSSIRGRRSAIRRRRGAAVPAGVEPGVGAARASTPGAIAEQGAFLDTLKSTYRFFALYAGDWTPGAGANAPRSTLDRWMLGAAGRTVEASHDGVGDVPRHGGSARDRRFRGRRPVELVRAALAGALLGARPRGRPRRGRDAARMPGHGGPAARAGRAVRGRLAAPRAHGRVGAPGADSRSPARRAGRGAGGGDGRGPPARGLGRAARETKNIRVRQPLSRCRWRCRRATAGRSSTSCCRCSPSEVNVRAVSRWPPMPTSCGSRRSPTSARWARSSASARRRRPPRSRRLTSRACGCSRQGVDASID